MNKLLWVILMFSSIQNDLLGQTHKDQIHKDFLSLVDSDDKTPIYNQIILDKDWLSFLSDSLNVENGLRGGCSITDLHEVFETFDFETILEQEGHFSNVEKWDKKKLPGLPIKNRIPENGNYAQYSVPFFSGEWGIIRRQYFEDKELLEDSIIVYTRDNKEKWNQVCQLFLSLSFPHYTID
jgi:hypothetical protein